MPVLSRVQCFIQARSQVRRTWLGGRSERAASRENAAARSEIATCSTSGAPYVCGLSLHSTRAALRTLAVTSSAAGCHAAAGCTCAQREHVVALPRARLARR